MKIAVATSKDLPNFTEADKISLKVFIDNGFQIIPVVWNDKNIDWKVFDLVIIRSVWDYFHDIEKFYDWLELLRKLNVKTFNSIDTIKNNCHKFYLKKLRENEIKIIPTVFVEKTENLNFDFLTTTHWEKIIIKPAISACSYSTEVFEREDIKQIKKKYSEFAKTNDLLIQKFVPEIMENGEMSMIFFNKKFSHAIVKKPKNGDFRVQYQYGGKYHEVEPPKEILEICKKILSLYPENMLFSRFDGVFSGNKFYIMEVELIEPDLYFDIVDYAKFNFFQAFKDLL